MNSDNLLAWFLIIFIADLCAATIWAIVHYMVISWWEKAKANVKCDICMQPRKTRKTFDGKYYACKKCRILYNKENRPPKQEEAN